MTTAAELGNTQQLFDSLRQGIETLDLGQEVQFTQYTKKILPLDGFIFWTPGVTQTFKGSLHISQDTAQNPDELIGTAMLIFTAEGQITEFSNAPSDTIWVATVGDNAGTNGSNIRFAFTKQTGFYFQAGIWHYVGERIAPAMESQLLDPPVTIDFTRAVVSNSMPFWLQLRNYMPTSYTGFTNEVPLYPAYLVSDNLEPPYGVIDIKRTEILQAVPLLGVYGSHTQLCKDYITITMYGLQNNECLEFQDCVNQYSMTTDNFGLMNAPVFYDDRRTQPEIRAIAMKKTMDIEVSYYQSASIAVAYQLLEEAFITVDIGELFI